MTSWTCTHAGIAPGEEVAETLVVGAKVVGGMPGDVLVVTASAQTTGRELRTDNNSGRASVKWWLPPLSAGSCGTNSTVMGSEKPASLQSPAGPRASRFCGSSLRASTLCRRSTEL